MDGYSYGFKKHLTHIRALLGFNFDILLCSVLTQPQQSLVLQKYKWALTWLATITALDNVSLALHKEELLLYVEWATSFPNSLKKGKEHCSGSRRSRLHWDMHHPNSRIIEIVRNYNVVWGCSQDDALLAWLQCFQGSLPFYTSPRIHIAWGQFCPYSRGETGGFLLPLLWKPDLGRNDLCLRDWSTVIKCHKVV